MKSSNFFHMKIFKQTTSYHSIVIDITCDMCGGSCKEGNRFEVLSIRAHFTSEKLGGHVCKKCTVEKLMPIIHLKVETWQTPILNDTPTK